MGSAGADLDVLQIVEFNRGSFVVFGAASGILTLILAEILLSIKMY